MSPETSYTRSESTGKVLPKAGECLYWHASGNYYGPVSQGGKQFQRSLDASDLKFAERRLAADASSLSGAGHCQCFAIEETAHWPRF